MVGARVRFCKKTWLSFSDCIFRKKIVGEISIFNKDYEGRSSSFEQKAPFANRLSQGGLKLHLRRRCERLKLWIEDKKIIT